MKLFSIILLVFNITCTAIQDQKESLITGEWIEFKTRTVSVDSLTWAGKKLEPSYHVEYGEKGKGRDLTWDELRFSYKLEGDTLRQGNRKFVVQLLTSEELVLRAWDDFSPSNDDRVHYFKRVPKRN